MANGKKNNASNIIKLPTGFTGSGGQQLSRDEVRSRKKKRLKRRRAIRKALLSFVLLLVVGIIGLVLALTVFFKVDTIKVKGSKAYPQKIILENCGVETGDSLLLCGEEQVAENLINSLPFVGSVTIERDLPSTLIINVTDTYSSAAISNKGNFILINENGKVLDSDAAILNEGIPMVTGVETESFKESEVITFKTEENGDILIELLKAVKRAGISGLTEIDVTDTSDVFMIYNDRIKILVGSSVNLETKILRAAEAIERENEINQYKVGILDLRTEPKVYFKAGDYETTTVLAEETTDNLNKTQEKTTNEQ
ncbi:MAG: FtsQ-type POTRA domain-containing protein [Clostridia bacterium]|nr:FtsQ-type POTRA domain-containing protein [Clostridia bacterium]